MASSLRVNAIVPASGTNVAIGTAGGTITYTASVSGVSTFSSGIVVSAGTTAAPSISPTGDSNTGIFFPSSDTVCIGEGGSEVIRVDSSGRVGVGTNRMTRPFEVWSGTAGTSFSVDSAGRMTVPNQPGFLAAKNNSEQTVAGTIVFNTVSANGGHNIGNHYSTSTGAFTAPIAGRYAFMCSIHSTNGNNKVDTRLRINGNDSPGGFALNNVDSYTQATGCVVLNLAANDAVTIYHVSGGVWPDVGLTYFSGYLVG